MLRWFEHPDSPFSPKRAKELKSSVSPDTLPKNKIYLGDNYVLEFLYRVNESVKNEILTQIPLLKYQQKIVFDIQNPEKPFEIRLGAGRHFEARLAKITRINEPEFCTYVAVRKVKAEKTLQADFLKESQAFKSRQAISRGEIIEASHKEFKLFETLIELKETKNFSIAWLVVHKLNKENKEQLYQCFPLADMGDGERFIEMINTANLTPSERLELCEYIARILLLSVGNINSKMFFLRDIKPSNILFSSNGNVWLSDCGASKYYGKDGKIISASNNVDSKYRAPFNLFHSLTDEDRDAIQDSWTLALTILQFYSYPLRNFIEDEFLDFSGKKTDLTIPAIKEHYRRAIDTLRNMVWFKNLSLDLRKIILGMLEIDQNKRLSLDKLIEQNGINVESWCKRTASINEIFKKITTTAFSVQVENERKEAINAGYSSSNEGIDNDNDHKANNNNMESLLSFPGKR